MPAMANPEVFDLYFRRADLNGDGQISGNEAVAFFQGANLPQATLAKIWQFADQGQRGFLSRPEFYNALKLVTVAQTGRELTYEIVRAALAGPAAAQIPPPKIAAPGGVAGGLAPQPQQPQQHQQQQPQSYGASPSPGFSARPVPLTPPPGQVRIGTGGLGPDGIRPSGPGTFGTGSGFPMFTTENRPGSFGADSWPKPSAPAPAPASAPAPGPVSVAGGQLPSPRGSVNALQGKPAASAPPALDAFDPFGPGFKVTPTSSSVSSDASLGLDALSTSSVKPVTAPVQQKPQASSTAAVFGDAFQAEAGLALVPTTPAVTQAGSGTVASTVVARPPEVSSALATAGPPPTSAAPWPKMTQADKQRYAKVFAAVDRDKDGKISGTEARDLFLSWQLPREVLKQVWDLSDQDGDSMLSFREFCTALYLMDRWREGRPLPPVLPPGFHLDEPATDEWQSIAAKRVAEAQEVMSQQSGGYNVALWQPVPGLVPPQVSVRPEQQRGPGFVQPQIQRPVVAPEADKAGAFKSKLTVLEPHLVAQLHKDEQEALKSKHQEAEAAEKKAYEMDRDIMDSKEKMEFYKTKLQEIILFKTRCDNRLAETVERSASEKREVEALSKKYDEKFKQSGESNSRLLAEEAAFRDLQQRKMDLYHAIAKMDQGGDGNVLLQKQADRISQDLDELRKALNERAKRLGLKVKASVATEPPFGWQPGLQETAAEWDEDWDKFDDEGFTPVDESPSQELADKSEENHVTPPVSAAPSVNAPISWDDGTFFDDGFEFPSDSKLPENGAHIAASEKLSSTGGSFRVESEEGSPKSVAESTLFSHRHQFDPEPVEKEVVGPPTPRSFDAFGDSPLDIRSTDISSPGRGDHGNGHSLADDFAGSFTSFASSKDESDFFNSSAGGTFETSLFTESPGHVKTYARTDTSRETFMRFDSFSSVKDTPRQKFGSFDDDPFAGTGPFGATAGQGQGQGGQTTKPSFDWSAF